MLKQTTNQFIADERGATAVEYGLIMGLMTLALVGALSTTGQNTGDHWNNISDEVETAAEGAGV